MTITDWEEKMSLFFIFGWSSLLIAIIGDLLVSTILSLFYKEYNIGTEQIPIPMRVPIPIPVF